MLAVWGCLKFFPELGGVGIGRDYGNTGRGKLTQVVELALKYYILKSQLTMAL